MPCDFLRCPWSIPWIPHLARQPLWKYILCTVETGITCHGLSVVSMLHRSLQLQFQLLQMRMLSQHHLANQVPAHLVNHHLVMPSVLSVACLQILLESQHHLLIQLTSFLQKQCGHSPSCYSLGILGLQPNVQSFHNPGTSSLIWILGVSFFDLPGTSFLLSILSFLLSIFQILFPCSWIFLWTCPFLFLWTCPSSNMLRQGEGLHSTPKDDPRTNMLPAG